MRKICSDYSEFPSNALKAYDAAIRSGDQRAATAAYSNIKPFLAGVARTYCKRPADWPRYEQAGLIAITRTCGQFDSDRGKPIQHLVRVAVKNAMLDELRKDKSWGRVELSGLDYIAVDNPRFHCHDTPSDSLVRSELRAHLAAQVRIWLEDCTPRQRDFVRLHFFDGLPQARVADRLGVSKAAISKLRKTTLNRARVQLADVHAFVLRN